jgi:hypothetical protein
MPVLSMLLPVLNALRAGGRWVVARPGLAVVVVLAIVAAGEHRAAGRWADKARAAQAGWDADRAQAILASQAADQRYRSLAHDADANQAQIAAEGDQRLAAYIADHRMRRGAQADAGGAGQGGRAPVFAGAAGQAILAQVMAPGNDPVEVRDPVEVSEEDMRRCDADYAYARAAFEWARGL